MRTVQERLKRRRCTSLKAGHPVFGRHTRARPLNCSRWPNSGITDEAAEATMRFRKAAEQRESAAHTIGDLFGLPETSRLRRG